MRLKFSPRFQEGLCNASDDCHKVQSNCYWAGYALFLSPEGEDSSVRIQSTLELEIRSLQLETQSAFAEMEHFLVSGMGKVPKNLFGGCIEAQQHLSNTCGTFDSQVSYSS